MFIITQNVMILFHAKFIINIMVKIYIYIYKMMFDIYLYILITTIEYKVKQKYP